jgi:hypothetical protein
MTWSKTVGKYSHRNYKYLPIVRQVYTHTEIVQNVLIANPVVLSLNLKQ